ARRGGRRAGARALHAAGDGALRAGATGGRRLRAHRATLRRKDRPAMTDPQVISARGVVKTFGIPRALDGLDLEVRPGEVHGFLGPNGAGKSTTMRVLLGLLRADGGEGQIGRAHV